MFVLLGWGLQTATMDPHGLADATPIGRVDVEEVEPLYGKIWTPERSLDWSPDGRRLALGGDSVTIIDSWTGRTQSRSTVPGLINSVRWSPNGEFLAVGVDKGLDGPGGVAILNKYGGFWHSWKAHNRTIGALAWSPDGGQLFTTSVIEFAIWSWNQAGGREIYRNSNASTHGESASWSPDGSLLAVGSLGGPAVYNAETGELLWDASVTYPVDGYYGAQVEWSPEGDRVAAGLSPLGLRIFGRDGSLEFEVLPTPMGGPSFGSPLSWSPDGSLIALAVSSGLYIFSAEDGTILRRLVFPTEAFRATPLENPLDWRVAWSPQGGAIASTATTSHPTLRVWGIRNAPEVVPLAALGVALALGLTLLFARDLYGIFRRAEVQAEKWLEEDPVLPLGRLLFVLALVSSWAVALFGHALDRIYGLQPLPPADWFMTTGLLSALFLLLPAFVAVKAFHGAIWPLEKPRPFLQRKYQVFGIVLLPFLWSLGIALTLLAVLLGAGVVSSLTAPLAVAGPAVILGFGFYLSGRTLQGFPEVESWRAWWGLLASALASIAAFFGLALLFLLILILFRVPPPGEFGFQLLFGFGYVPLLMAIILLTTGGRALGTSRLGPLLLAAYSRLRGQDVLHLESRKRVLDLVQAQPGIHFRELLRKSRLGSGTLHYHLSVLERERLLTSRRDGMRKRYYPGREETSL